MLFHFFWTVLSLGLENSTNINFICDPSNILTIWGVKLNQGAYHSVGTNYLNVAIIWRSRKSANLNCPADEYSVAQASSNCTIMWKAYLFWKGSHLFGRGLRVWLLTRLRSQGKIRYLERIHILFSLSKGYKITSFKETWRPANS